MQITFQNFLATCGLYYKPMTIINDDSRVVAKLETSLTDNARVVIYDCHMFIVQANGLYFLLDIKFGNFLQSEITGRNICKYV